MQDTVFIKRSRIAGWGALAASGACVAMSGYAGNAHAQSMDEASALSPPDEDAPRAQAVQDLDPRLDSAPFDFQPASSQGAAEIGHASYYASKFQGQRTASGERYDMRAFTAAHRTLPLGSYARVSNLSKTKSVIVRINDRGPYVRGRAIDLSYAAASVLGLQGMGSGQVVIERVSQRVAQASTPMAPERIMLHIARPAYHHRKHAQR
jgi:rare lipoprotein A